MKLHFTWKFACARSLVTQAVSQTDGEEKSQFFSQPWKKKKRNKNLLISQIFFLFYKKYLCAEPPHDGRVLQVHPLQDVAEKAGEAEELVGQSGVGSKIPKG